MSEPVRVFVSYASQDRDFAERLISDLQAADAEVWWDVSGINEGDFLDKINQALQQCQWLVLVLTPNAVASRWVNIEVNAAINRREKSLMRGVLPVLASSIAHDAIPPIWDNLHRYDGVGNYSSEIARLIRVLGLSSAPTEPPRAQTPHPQSAVSAASKIGQALGDFLAAIDLSRPVPKPLSPPIQAPKSPTAPQAIPQLLVNLGYQTRVLEGAEVILPPLCDVTAGEFLIGSDRKKDHDADKDELPQHRVTLPAFRIARYPVTVAEYSRFVRTGYKEPKHWQDQLSKVQRDHPVTYVSWHDAIAYATWLARLTKDSWRLPTEAEWEKAARGTDGRTYPWGNDFDLSKDVAYGAVGQHLGTTSPYGVCDMSGNVWEWTSSLYRPYPYDASDGREALDAPGHRVLRGGWYKELGGSSWFRRRDENYARAACRGNSRPTNGNYNDGFRLVLALPTDKLM